MSQSEVLMMSSPLSLFCIEQDSFTKKRMLSGSHELGGSYSRSKASQVLAPLPPPHLLVIRARLVAPPLLGARRCWPSSNKASLGIPPGPGSSSLHTHHSLSQTAVTKQGTTFLVCRVTWDKMGHTCWISPRKGLQRTGWRVLIRAGPNGRAHLLALALCLSLPHNSWAHLPQSADRRTCLLPASGTAGKRVGERLKCYMWKWKWSPLPWEVTCWAVTYRVRRLMGLFLLAGLSMKSVRWYHLRLTVTLAKSHNEDVVIATSQVKVASHRDAGKSSAGQSAVLPNQASLNTIILSWQSTCFRIHVRLHVWPLMNLLFLSCL